MTEGKITLYSKRKEGNYESFFISKQSLCKVTFHFLNIFYAVCLLKYQKFHRNDKHKIVQLSFSKMFIRNVYSNK